MVCDWSSTEFLCIGWLIQHVFHGAFSFSIVGSMVWTGYYVIDGLILAPQFKLCRGEDGCAICMDVPRHSILPAHSYDCTDYAWSLGVFTQFSGSCIVCVIIYHAKDASPLEVAWVSNQAFHCFNSLNLLVQWYFWIWGMLLLTRITIVDHFNNILLKSRPKTLIFAHKIVLIWPWCTLCRYLKISTYIFGGITILQPFIISPL